MKSVEKEELIELVGINKVMSFEIIVETINSLYDMEKSWNNGGKKWTYEYKFRKSSKTLCAMYFKKDVLGLMIIFGKDERNKVELIRGELSSEILTEYDKAETFHDGKWVMFNINDTSLLEDIMKLLYIKRKPNKK